MDRLHSRYLEIAADLRERIYRGVYVPGANLPRLQDLAAEFDANRDTIGRAITVLESEGLVWAVPPGGAPRCATACPARGGFGATSLSATLQPTVPATAFPALPGRRFGFTTSLRSRGTKS